MPVGSGSGSIRTGSGAFTREAFPLPDKKPGWEPLHLTFRHSALPRLPTIHSPAIMKVLQCPAYEQTVGPSNLSIKTLAWMGDAVLYLAATKAILRAAVGGRNGGHLTAIRSGLTTNRTFSYLTASYRIVTALCPAHVGGGQKRHADFFEAYVGAAWISAKETQDQAQITAIEAFCSKLFKPEVWPALESLEHGHVGTLNAVKIQQDLEGGSDADGGRDDGDTGDVSVFDIPPPQARPQHAAGTHGRGGGGGGGKKQKRSMTTSAHLGRKGDRERRWQAESSLHAHQRRRAIASVRSARSATLRSGSSGEPIILD